MAKEGEEAEKQKNLRTLFLEKDMESVKKNSEKI